MGDFDVPSPIDFHDPAQAKSWEQNTIVRRPWRPEFFQAFASELNSRFSQPFSVLELGSGPGHLAQQILSACQVARYCALDFSDAMHALACERLGPFAAKVEFVIRDFRSAEWSEGLGRFDAVVTMQAAHEIRHKRHLPKLLTQIRAVMVPDGILLYCDHYAEGGENSDLMLNRDDQPLVLERAGFTDVRRLLEKGGMALYAAKPG